MPSLWGRLGELIINATSDAISAIVERVRTVFAGDPKTRRQVAFSVAMIALSAKMAKADGVVSDAEVKAFYEIFQVPHNEIRNVERLYNIAKQDIAGFDIYATKLFHLCQENDCKKSLLEDVLDGLFYIAKSDDVLHENEMAFLGKVAHIFGLSKIRFEAIAARHVASEQKDPWSILGLDRGASYEDAKKRYRQLVKENHPDIVMARGLPAEFLAIANARLATINHAWALLREEYVVA